MDSIEKFQEYKANKKNIKEENKKKRKVVSSTKSKGSTQNKSSSKSTKKKNKTTSKKLKSILLDLVLIYGKIKDTDTNGIGCCCTCSLVGLWTSMQGGHFIPQSKGLSTKFELDNVNLQCAGCNGKANQGEQYKHGLYIDNRYGKGRAEELHRQAQKPRQWKIYQLEEVIEDIENKILDLCKNNGIARTALLVGYIIKNSQRKSNCKNLLIKITDLC